MLAMTLFVWVAALLACNSRHVLLWSSELDTACCTMSPVLASSMRNSAWACQVMLRDALSTQPAVALAVRQHVS